jgi:putative ABC transport system permease protein
MAGQLVSGNYYATLGVNAALGRTILPDDNRMPGEAPVCVISYNYWQRRFAGDPAVIGKTTHLLAGEMQVDRDQEAVMLA